MKFNKVKNRSHFNDIRHFYFCHIKPTGNLTHYRIRPTIFLCSIINIRVFENIHVPIRMFNEDSDRNEFIEKLMEM